MHRLEYNTRATPKQQGRKHPRVQVGCGTSETQGCYATCNSWTTYNISFLSYYIDRENQTSLSHPLRGWEKGVMKDTR